MNITKEQIKVWLDNIGFTPDIKVIDEGDKKTLKLAYLIFECFNDLSPKWVSLDNPPKINCMAWVKRGPYLEVYEYYICPEYHYGSWLDENKDDIELSGGEWMPLPEPTK